MNDAERDSRTPKERKHCGPALAKVHSGCKEKDFKHSIAGVDAYE